MADVLTESGEYLTDKSHQNFRQMLLTAYAGGCITALICGLWLGFEKWGPKTSLWLSLLMFLLVITGMALIYRVVSRKIDGFEKARRNFSKGATGESMIARIIALLPDEYIVINDLNTTYGNLDHVVIGPKGIFVIETKNWKGLIESDSNGDLLLNGTPLEKPVIKPLVSRIMSVRKKVATLCDKDLLNFFYFNGVIVFPSAYVRAKWGKTGNANCVSEEMLRDYILESLTSRPLSPKEINKLAKAFLALQTMDKKLADKTSA